MSEKGIVGTLSIHFDDGEGELEVVTLVSATLQRQTEMLKALDPNVYGWKYSIPGEQSWRADGSHIEVLDSGTGSRAEALARLEAAWQNKAVLTCRFQSPIIPSEYVGLGIVDLFQLGEAYDAGYRGVFGIEGRAAMQLLEDIEPDWCPQTFYQTNYWGTPSPSAPLKMGLDPGWVKIKDFTGASAGGTLYVFYNGVLIHKVDCFGKPEICGGGGPGEETFFYYDPNPGGPYTIGIAQVLEVADLCGCIPFNPSCAVTVWCPGVEEPPPGWGEGEGEGE